MVCVCVCVCVCVYEHLDACVWAGLWAPFERERFIRFCISNALMKCLLNWKGLHGLKVLWGNPVYIINLLGKFFLDSNKIQFLASLCPNLKFHLSETPSSFCESVAWCHQSCLYFFSKCSWEDSSLHAGSIAWSMRSIGPELSIWPAGSPQTHKPHPVHLTQVGHAHLVSEGRVKLERPTWFAWRGMVFCVLWHKTQLVQILAPALSKGVALVSSLILTETQSPFL